MSRPTLDTLRRQLQQMPDLPVGGKQHLIAVMDAYKMQLVLAYGRRTLIMASGVSILGNLLWSALVAWWLSPAGILFALGVQVLVAFGGYLAWQELRKRHPTVSLATRPGRLVILAYATVMLLVSTLAATVLAVYVIYTAVEVYRGARRASQQIVLGNRQVSLLDLRSDRRYLATVVLCLMAVEVERRVFILRRMPRMAGQLAEQVRIREWFDQTFATLAESYDRAELGQDPGEEWPEIEKEILGRLPHYRPKLVAVQS